MNPEAPMPENDAAGLEQSAPFATRTEAALESKQNQGSKKLTAWLAGHLGRFAIESNRAPMSQPETKHQECPIEQPLSTGAGQPLNHSGLVYSQLPPNSTIMKKLTARLALVTLVALTTTNALAALVAYEPFNYTIGASTTPTTATGTPTQTTGGGFASSYQGGGNTAVAGLTYTGLGVNGNALKQTASYSGVNLSSPVSSGTIYVSFLFNMAVNPGGNRVGLEMNTGGNGMFVGFTAPYSATQGFWGVNQQTGYNDNGGNEFQYPSANITYGTTYFCVVKLVDAGANWNGSIWINPTANTSTETPASPDGTFTVPKFTISACSIVNPNGGDFLFDELRLGTTWSDAVSYTAPTALNVSITSPSNGSTQGNYFTINATASISPGTITNVSFFDGATLLSSSGSQPYSCNANLIAGAHTLTAIAYANSNSVPVTATNSISITVTDTPPLVVYEPFNYTLGGINNGTAATGSGLSGNWTFANNTSDSIVAGLAYPNLPTANNALKQTQAGARSLVNFVSPAGGGTKYFSFLFKNNVVSGGESIGAFLVGSGANSLFVGFQGGYSGTQARFGLGSILTANGTAASAATMWNTVPVTSTATNLIVVRIDFNTSGANDTVSLWINPLAGTNAPGAVADVVDSSHDVGTISGFGLNVEGGYSPTVDELRAGDTYGSVVGAPNPTVVTTVALSTNLASTVSWTAQSTNVYQPQSSPDNSTWSNVGSQINGNTTTSIVDPANAAYYQVLEYYPVTTEVVANGGFDYDTGLSPDTAQNWNSLQSQPPVWINTDGHAANGCMDLAVTNITATPNGSELQQNTLMQGNPVTPGASYNLSLWAKQISSGVSYVQQYNVQWLGSGSVFLGQSGFVNFTGGNGTWAHITQNGIVAPAGAVTALIQIIGSTGAVLGGYGEVLVDDVSLTETAFTGGPNVLAPTVQRQMTFVASILTNGVPAIDATGTVNFKTNNLQLSVNAVAAGVANSAGTSINPPYTVTAIYSGDNTYLGSTGTLTVGGSLPNPCTLTNSVVGNTLHLTWPAGQGWRLEDQTNSLSTGLNPNPGAWFTVPGASDGSHSVVINPSNPAVFFRLVSP
jgi:hypothetical protein